MTHPPYPGPPTAPDAFPPQQHPGPPQISRGFNPASGLAYAAMAAAGLFTLFEIVEAGFAFAAQDDYVEASRQDLDAVDVLTAYDLVAIPWTLIVIATYVISCLWLSQVRTNAEHLEPGAPHARGRGWVWGSWIVPVVNLWFPFQVVRDIAKRPNSPAPGRLLGWWWVFWLVYIISSRIGPSLTSFGEISPAISALGAVESVNAGFCAAAFVLWLAVITHIRRGQKASASERQV